MFVYVFLGAFAKGQKVTVSFVISVRLTVWNNSAPTGWIFTKFLYLSIFLKICQNSSFIKIGQE